MGQRNLIYPAKNFHLLLENTRRNLFIIPFQLSQEQGKELESKNFDQNTFVKYIGFFHSRRSAYLTWIFSHNGVEQQSHWSRYVNQKKSKKPSRQSGPSGEEKKIELPIFSGDINFPGKIDKKCRSMQDIHILDNFFALMYIPGGLTIGAELTIAQSLHSLVNKIQKNMKFLMLFARTNWVVVAEQTGIALEEAICHRAVLLGITRTSRHTQSFLSVASFHSSFSESCSPGPSRLVKRTKSKCCSEGNEPCWYWIQRIRTPFKSKKEHSLENPKKRRYSREKRERFCFTIENYLILFFQRIFTIDQNKNDFWA
ncbi:hypothetical protein Cgig2_024589 [Carnegiea gigantea]|uniref:Uncharacterized protein n=1 Tax=Carnegiea gigantea TaxID=171969 RepID=A0A9Q1KJ12_9CARY|nr:hypothetical protein Cgig2_024589 [Carnegiea gigantea]